MATQTVKVQSGDTLSAIAAKYGISVGDISGYSSGNPNLIFPGENLTLSNIGSSVKASDIKPATTVNLPTQTTQTATGTASLFAGGDSVSKQVDKYRKQLDSMISTKKNEVDAKLKAAQQKEKDTLSQVETLTTPFRQDLETAQRESLYINQNFEDNQKLIDELDSLLTEGNNLIKQQQGVTGLASVRNPRIQKTMDDVASRAGVIEAVINARNGQIAVAENMIDRTANAIASDRKDQLSYYQTVLELNRQDIVSLSAEDKDLANAQMALIENDMKRAQATQDKIKELLIDPATASLMADAGISLKDSVETINVKLAKASKTKEIRDWVNINVLAKGGVAITDPNSVPADQLLTYTGPDGVTRYYKMPKSTTGTGGPIISSTDPKVQAWVEAIKGGTATLSNVPAALKTSVASALNESSVTDKDVADAIKVLAKVDVAYYGTADKMLSAQEITDAYNELMKTYGNSETALAVLQKAINTGGYSEWKG